MSTAELRKKLMEKVVATENRKLLAAAYALLCGDTAVLTNEQKAAIAAARQEIAAGDFLTEEEANREIDEWLNK